MISFLQRVLQKHHKWLFSILLFVVIVSFVFTVGASPGINRSSNHAKGKLFGLDLSKKNQVESAMAEVQMSARLHYLPIFFSQQLEQMLFFRLASLKLADDLSIPFPNKETLSQFVKTYPAFWNKNRKFDSKIYNDFLDETNKSSDTLATLENTIADDWRISIIQKALDKNGFYLLKQAIGDLKKEQTKYSFLLATISDENFPQVTEYSPEELQQYFDSNKELYQIPEKFAVDVLTFAKEKFLKDVPLPSKEELKSFYLDNKNSFKDLEEGSEELKKAIIDRYETARAVSIAAKAAEGFAYELYEKNIAGDSSEFKDLLKRNSINSKDLELFDLKNPPTDLEIAASDLMVVKDLDNSHYFSDPIKDKDGNICILILKDKIPGITPPLEVVKDEVSKDFLKKKTGEAFRSFAKDNYGKLTKNVLESGNAFEEIAKALGFSVELIEAQTLSQLQKNFQNNELKTISLVKQNSISDLIETAKGMAKIIYMEAKEEPEKIENGQIDVFCEKIEKQNGQKFYYEFLSSMVEEAIKGLR